MSAALVTIPAVAAKRTPNPNSAAYRFGQRCANAVTHVDNARTWTIDTVAQAAVDVPAGYRAQAEINRVAPVARRARS